MTQRRDRDQLAGELLVGRAVYDKRGLPRQVFLKPGSAKELEARRALAKVLRTEHDWSVQTALADMIDPDSGYYRYIHFQNRRAGKPNEFQAEYHIAEFILTRTKGGKLTKRVIGEVEDKFGVHTRHTRKIWTRWKQALVREYRIYGPLSEENASKYWPKNRR
jgi:hypothetical protein